MPCRNQHLYVIPLYYVTKRKKDKKILKKLFQQPVGIHGSDEGFTSVFTCSQLKSSSSDWLYPHEVNGSSNEQPPV